jgi:cytochrome b6-f complex iron-sulfur subunit
MSSGAIIAIGIAAVVVLAAVLFITAARKADVRGAGALSRETRQRDRAIQPVVSAPTGAEIEQLAADQRAGAAVTKAAGLPPAPWIPPDPEVIGVNRRQFFNRTLVTMMSVSLGSFGLACIAFLYPKQGGGFGSKVNAGKLDDIIQGIRGSRGFFYLPEARTWITEYPGDAIAKAEANYSGPVLDGMKAGIVALYQKCPHLGCRVPECASSQWFECPCHGSQYNRVGEKKGGPAPRGMDRFGVAINNGNVVIDTALVVQGPAIGVNTTGQEAEGPHCIGAGGGSH